MTKAKDAPLSDTPALAPKVRVWRIRLYDGDRIADEWLSNMKPWDLGRARCQFIERGTNVTTTVEGQFTIARVEVER
jgi:hypothetical protein